MDKPTIGGTVLRDVTKRNSKEMSCHAKEKCHLSRTAQKRTVQRNFDKGGLVQYLRMFLFYGNHHAGQYLSEISSDHRLSYVEGKRYTGLIYHPKKKIKKEHPILGVRCRTSFIAA